MNDKNTKYMINLGLDIAEEYMMKKFSALSREGWHLESMTAMGFKFVKSQPQNKIFALDYQTNIKDLDEYRAIFEGAGWELVCSCGEFYIFSADEGTCEIYTDKSELNNKINSRFKGVLITWSAAILLCAAIVFVFGMSEIGGFLLFLCEAVMLLSLAVFGACTPWMIGLLNKKRKMR